MIMRSTVEYDGQGMVTYIAVPPDNAGGEVTVELSAFLGFTIPA